MRINENFRLPKLIIGLALLFAITPLVYGQAATPQTTAVERNIQSIPNGAKLKFKGVVIAREGETFRIRDRNRTDYQVLITDSTSVKANGGFLRSGKKYPVTDILRGLIVEVEGRGDSQGQLAAEKIRFDESDMRAAITSDTRVTPVEENQQRMAGQMDELYAVAAEARNEATAANTRIDDLDEYDVQANVAVTFRVNSAVLSPEAVATRRPSALKTAALTGPPCLRGAPTGAPEATSQTCAFVSSDAVTTSRPSGLNAATLTLLMCLRGALTGWPVATSQTRAVSPELVKTRRPSGLNEAAWRPSGC